MPSTQAGALDRLQTLQERFEETGGSGFWGFWCLGFRALGFRVQCFGLFLLLRVQGLGVVSVLGFRACLRVPSVLWFRGVLASGIFSF